jgi:hypothetical protein
VNPVLPCIRCGKELFSAIPQVTDLNQPDNGTTFRSYGNYGSTVWDENDGTFLELNVCDPCLLEVAAMGQVLRVRKRRSTIYHAEAWPGPASSVTAAPASKAEDAGLIPARGAQTQTEGNADADNQDGTGQAAGDTGGQPG